MPDSSNLVALADALVVELEAFLYALAFERAHWKNRPPDVLTGWDRTTAALVAYEQARGVTVR
jgi:hypothetical protein